MYEMRCCCILTADHKGSKFFHGPGGSSYICQVVNELLLSRETRLLNIVTMRPNHVSQPMCVFAALSQPQVEMTGSTVKINMKIPTYISCMNFHCYNNVSNSKDAQLSDTD